MSFPLTAPALLAGQLFGRARLPGAVPNIGRAATLREIGTGLAEQFGGRPVTRLSGPQQEANRLAQANVARMGANAARALQGQLFQEQRALLPIVSGLDTRMLISRDRIATARQELGRLDRLPEAQTPEGRFNRAELRRNLLEGIFMDIKRAGDEQVRAEERKVTLLQRQVELENRKSDILRGSILTGQQRTLLQTRGERALEARAIAQVQQTGLLPAGREARMRLFETQGMVGTESALGRQLAEATAATAAREVPGGTALVRDLQAQRRAHEEAIIADELFGDQPDVDSTEAKVIRGLEGIIRELKQASSAEKEAALDLQQAVRDRETGSAARGQ